MWASGSNIGTRAEAGHPRHRRTDQNSLCVHRASTLFLFDHGRVQPAHEVILGELDVGPMDDHAQKKWHFNDSEKRVPLSKCYDGKTHQDQCHRKQRRVREMVLQGMGHSALALQHAADWL